MQELTIERLKGAQIQDYLLDVGRLRIEVFKEYPYLYDGNIEYEISYLKTYFDCPNITLVLVKDGSHIVGALTAIPLAFETTEWQKPFLKKKFDISKIFYFGESVLLPKYRGRGVYRHFFQEREAAAKEYGSLFTTFCTIVRPVDDSKRPSHYVPLDEIWHRYNYKKYPELTTEYEWKEIGEKTQTAKPMIFWMKSL